MTQDQWFTSAELAELKLAGLPASKRKINERALLENWALAVDDRGQPLARRRAGRGGGYEYHASLLPPAARADLARRQDVTGEEGADICNGDGDAWAWFARQPQTVKDEARRRLSAIGRIEAFEAAGMTRSTAVAAASAEDGASSATLWNWLKLINGVAPENRLPAIAPRRQGGGREQDVDPDLWTMLLSDYLRLSQPRWSESVRRVEETAKVNGLSLPHPKTLWRKFQREVPKPVVILRRKGEEALRRSLPAQSRSVADLHAMELVNIDGHKCDVFVRWPDGRIGRPTMVAIQDVYSRKFLSWRVAESEDMVTARLAFADLFRTYGIPKGLLADNGRAFASKWLTGGSKTRFRFKIRDEDPVGVLTALGVNIHWAKPYRGQSKPIERGFRDLASAVAKHPAFEGAYTGNSPMAKPENYASRAIDLDVFLKVWNAGMEAHNRQVGRRTEMGGGTRSFDQVFAESYAHAPIGKATDEQLRIALFAADQVSCDRRTATVTIGGNKYWAEELVGAMGQKVTVRFDPDDLSQPVHVYDRLGQFIATAPMVDAAGFLDMEGAKRRQRLEKRWKKAAKEAASALNLLSADALVAKLPDYEPEALPAPTVVRPVRSRGNVAAQLKPIPEASQEALNTPASEAAIDRMGRALLRIVE